MRQVEKLDASGLMTFGIPLKNLMQVKGGRRSRRYREQPETLGGEVSAEKGIIKWTE